MRTTHYTPLAPCPHGERTDRTTTEGTPLCPLCRIADARRTHIDPDTPDWMALAAGDDTHEDDEILAPVVEPPADTAAILLGSLLGRDDRIETMLQRWTERDTQGILF